MYNNNRDKTFKNTAGGTVLKKTLLVTGGSGFIGKNITERLSKKYDIIAPRRAQLDLTCQQSVDGFFASNKIDAVIHCAIKPGHRAARDLSGLLDADLRMYYNLRRNTEERGMRMFTLGSGSCYDLRNYAPKMREEDMGRSIPADETGFAKYITALDALGSNGIYDLRVFGIYGKYEDFTIRFISNAVCKALLGMPITLRQNRVFDYIFIDDFVDLLDGMMDKELKRHAYNVTPDEPVSLLRLAEIVREITGADVPINVASEGMGLEYTGDNGRLRKEFPDFKFTPYEDGIRMLCDYYRGNMHLLDRETLKVDK